MMFEEKTRPKLSRLSKGLIAAQALLLSVGIAAIAKAKRDSVRKDTCQKAEANHLDRPSFEKIKFTGEPFSGTGRNPSNNNTLKREKALPPKRVTPSEALFSYLSHTGGNLRRGSNGLAVKNLQKVLGINHDGDFGPATFRAVRAFQRKYHLRPRRYGVVDSYTAAALQEASTLKPEELKDLSTRYPFMKKGSLRPEVRQLRGLMVLSGVVDTHFDSSGKFCEGLVGLVREVQRKLGYPETGYASWKLQAELERRAKERCEKIHQELLEHFALADINDLKAKWNPVLGLSSSEYSQKAIEEAAGVTKINDPFPIREDFAQCLRAIGCAVDARDFSVECSATPKKRCNRKADHNRSRIPGDVSLNVQVVFFETLDFYARSLGVAPQERALLSVFAYIESGGNPDAAAAGTEAGPSSAEGAFQFLGDRKRTVSESCGIQKDDTSIGATCLRGITQVDLIRSRKIPGKTTLEASVNFAYGYHRDGLGSKNPAEGMQIARNKGLVRIWKTLLRRLR